MNKEFTIEGRTFRQVPANNGCDGCGGNYSGKESEENTDRLCLAISEYVSERNYKSCSGQGVIYMEVKE